MTQIKQSGPTAQTSKTGVALAIAAAAWLGLAGAAHAETIKKIVVAENTKTSYDTVVLIADIEVGDDFSFKLLDEIRVRLVSSELFKSVEVFSEPVPGGIQITILARDKHSWIIAPTFYNQPGNVGVGVGFAEANMWGQNKKLLLYGQIATSDEICNLLRAYGKIKFRPAPPSTSIFVTLRLCIVCETNNGK
jgi:outer membrane protein assembly factor BamA